MIVQKDAGATFAPPQDRNHIGSTLFRLVPFHLQAHPPQPLGDELSTGPFLARDARSAHQMLEEGNDPLSISIHHIQKSSL